MSALSESLGMSLMGSSIIPAVLAARMAKGVETGEKIVELVQKGVFIILTYCGASAAVLDNAHVRVELYLGIWTVFWSSRRRLRRKWLSGPLRRLPERKWWPRPLRTVWPQKPPLISTGLCKTKKKEIRAKQEKSPASVNPDAGLFHRSMPPSARMPRRAAPGRFG